MPEVVAITAGPRLSYTLMKGKEEPPLGSVWGDSELALPPEASRQATCATYSPARVLTVRRVNLYAAKSSPHFPFALLWLWD